MDLRYNTSMHSSPSEPSLAEVRAEAKAMGIPGYSKLNKQKLEKAILIAETLDWDLDHYRDEHREWNQGGLSRQDGFVASAGRAVRLSSTVGTLYVAEQAMHLAGKLGGSQVAAHGFRITRQIHHERKFIQSLMRQPLSSVADLLTHRGPAALINGSGHSARHHDSAWLDDAAHGDEKARRRMLQERLVMLGVVDG